MATTNYQNYQSPWLYGYNQPPTMSNQNGMNFNAQFPQQNTNNLMVVPINGGEATANAYPVASGNTVMLIDFEIGKFWLKSNVNGIPQRLRPFLFKEELPEQPQQVRQPATNVSREEFDKLSMSVSSLSDNVNKLIAELGGTTNE